MKYITLIITVGLFGSLTSWIMLHAKADMVNIESPNYDKVKKLRFEKGAFKFNFSPDGKTFAAGDEVGNVKLFETMTWKVKHELNHPDSAYLPLFSPDSKMFVTKTGELAKGGLRNSKVWFWDVETGKSLHVFNEGNVKHSISTMAFSPDGKTMVWGTSDGEIRLVDVSSLKNVTVNKGQFVNKNLYGISSIKFSPDGQLLAVGNETNPSLVVFDVKTGNEVFSFSFLESNILTVFNIAFSPDGKTLAIAGKFAKENDWQYTLRLFDTRTWEITADMKKHSGSIGLDFTPDGEVLVAVNGNGVDVVDILRKKSVKTIKYKGKHGLQDSALSPDGKSIAISGSLSKFVRIYPVRQSPLK